MRDDTWVRCPGCNEFVGVPGEEQLRTPLFAATCSHCGLEFDWRLRPDLDFLRGVTLAWQEYLAPSDAWDHDHCACCFQKLMEGIEPGTEQSGFVTYLDDAWWICKQCFDDLGEEMEWKVWPS